MRNALEKEQDEGNGDSWQGERTCYNLNGVTLEPRLEGGEQVSHAGIWGKSVPGRMNSECKGPGALACLAC